MSFETRYSIAKIAQSAAKGNYGIECETLGNVASERADELARTVTPWLDSYTGVQGSTNGTRRPSLWTDGDTFLRTKLGTTVSYDEEKIFSSGQHRITKTVGRYSSPLVQSLLKRQNNELLSEQSLMEDVDIVSDSLDLRTTGISSVPKLKKVGGNLTLDTNSKLKELPGLKEINGKLTVIAKDKDEMNNYLQTLGLIDENNTPKIPVRKGIEFVMKNYI